MHSRSLLLAALLLGAGAPAPRAEPPRRIRLAREVLDSMNAVFARSNEHWNELADLTWMERSLGTVRATQREFLGCLAGERRGDTLVVLGWEPARNMKRLMLAVTGDCSGVPRYIGTFHTHPYLADQENRATKQRRLAPQDLESFAASGDEVALVIWDTDSLDAALRVGVDSTLHPAPIQVE